MGIRCMCGGHCHSSFLCDLSVRVCCVVRERNGSYLLDATESVDVRVLLVGEVRGQQAMVCSTKEIVSTNRK